MHARAVRGSRPGKRKDGVHAPTRETAWAHGQQSGARETASRIWSAGGCDTCEVITKSFSRIVSCPFSESSAPLPLRGAAAMVDSTRRRRYSRGDGRDGSPAAAARVSVRASGRGRGREHEPRPFLEELGACARARGGGGCRMRRTCQSYGCSQARGGGRGRAHTGRGAGCVARRSAKLPCYCHCVECAVSAHYPRPAAGRCFGGIRVP